MAKSRLAYVLLSVLFLLGACMKEEKPVTLGVSVIDKKISMTKSKVDELNVEVYLISEDEVKEEELLAKAMDANGLEIGRAKQPLNLDKDESKLFTFTFDTSVEMDLVTKFVIDLRKK